MGKTDRTQRLLEKKKELEERLHDETIREHRRIDGMGFGYGMRHARINFSTLKSDRLRERIKKLEDEIESLRVGGMAAN